MSVLVKVTAADGTVGWGETYGIVAPRSGDRDHRRRAGPDGRRSRSARRRGDPGGPVRPHARARPLRRLSTSTRSPASTSRCGTCSASSSGCRSRSCSAASAPTRFPAYVSGLPRRDARRQAWRSRANWSASGFDAFKYAAAVSFDGIVAEMRALREALGPDVKLMVDLHWKFTAGGSDRADRRARAIPAVLRRGAVRAGRHRRPGAGGRARRACRSRWARSWRTVFEYRPRFTQRAMSVAQPEMGHTGISQFMQIARMAQRVPRQGDSRTRASA